MKNHPKKQLSVILVCILSLLLLTSCGQPTKIPTTATTENSSSEPTSENTLHSSTENSVFTEENTTEKIVENNSNSTNSTGNTSQNNSNSSTSTNKPSNQTNTNTNNNSNSNSNNISSNKPSSEKSNTLNPFYGISYTVSGISPFCNISINNQNCDDNVQKYVVYTLDKKEYANGETAVITASLTSSGKKLFTLENTTSYYTVSSQPEFLTSLSNVNTSLLEQELNDYVASEKASIVGNQHAFGYYSTFMITEVNSVNAQNIEYFSSLKKIRYNEIHNVGAFNVYSSLYQVTFTDRHDEQHTAYISINAKNIVKYPDGSITWGSTNIGAFDFSCESSGISIEDCISTHITGNSYYYNVSKIS